MKNDKRKRIIQMLLVMMILCMCSMTVFAAEPGENSSNNTSAEDYIELQVQNVSNFEEDKPIPAVDLNTNNSIQSIDSIQSSGGSYIKPSLIRSGNTEDVEVYLHYVGQKKANALRFKKLILEEATLLLPGSEYKVFEKSGKYITYDFGAAKTAYIRIGEVKIPTDVDKVRVKSKDLMVYYMDGSGWSSLSNIQGNWSMN